MRNCNKICNTIYIHCDCFQLLHEHTITVQICYDILITLHSVCLLYQLSICLLPFFGFCIDFDKFTYFSGGCGMEDGISNIVST